MSRKKGDLFKKKIQKVEPLFIDGKLVCPNCKEQKNMKIINYNLSKTKDGVLYKYLCEKCNVELKNEIKFKDFL